MKEFIHEVTRIHGVSSKCHIRILDEIDKPLVIMCSQLAEGAGNSVTNMAEYIAQDVKSNLELNNPTLTSSISHYFKKKKASEMIGDLANRLKSSQNYSVFTLEFIQQAFEFAEGYRSHKNRVNGFVWVEHYAAGIFSFVQEDLYSIVNFDAQSWQPNWVHGNVQTISDYTGYPVSYFTSPKESLKIPNSI